MDFYFPVRAGEELWMLLSPSLRGKEFRVPYGWRRGSSLSFRDWKLLVRNGAAGKMAYVQKTRRIDYRSILRKKVPPSEIGGLQSPERRS